VCTVPVLVAAGITCVLALARGRWTAAAESAALGALFLVVTPLLAFAVYFGLWHSWRQVARMIAVDALRDRVPAATALRRFGRSAALPTALTVAAAGVAVLTGGRSVLVVGLVSVLCLTVPHSIVVARSDRALRPPPDARRPRGRVGVDPSPAAELRSTPPWPTARPSR
jgi:Brp/Blh family beta-carotene 15,15'-monooxygenase